MKRLLVELLLDVVNDDEAYDAANEILREQQYTFNENSCLIDYALHGVEDTTEELNDTVCNEAYEKGEAFITPHHGIA